MADINEGINYEPSEFEGLAKETIELLAEGVVDGYDFDKLKHYAINFLKEYENYEIKIEKYNNKVQNLKRTLSPEQQKGSEELAKARAMRTTVLRDIYRKAFEFEEELNYFLYGDALPRSGIYVFENKDTHEVTAYEMSMMEMVDYVTYDGGAARFGSISKNTLDKFNRERERLTIEEQLKAKEEKIRIARAQAAYKGTVNRVNRYFEIKQGDSKSKGGNQGGYLLWKQKSQWKIMQIVNFGDVREAYVALIFDEKAAKIENLGLSPYYSHELIGDFAENYIHEVDNLSAILQEDVIGIGKQYGIKSQKAQLPSLDQYIWGANVIVDCFKDKDYNKKKIAAGIYNHYGEPVKRNIAKNMEDFSNDAVKTKIFEDVQKDFNKTIKTEIDF